jgi:hypothetical protein
VDVSEQHRGSTLLRAARFRRHRCDRRRERRASS